MKFLVVAVLLMTSYCSVFAQDKSTPAISTVQAGPIKTHCYSFRKGTDPLIVLTDEKGHQAIFKAGTRKRKLRRLSPDRIETITILKDAAAIAPYRKRGRNGVILITMKTI